MREITDHKLNGLNDALTVTVLDEPGVGGGCHQYSIRWKNERDQTEPHCFIGFQKGPIQEAGVNGISQEAILAIVIDRLRCYQAGKYACESNARALTNLELAMHNLQERTLERTARGVEGTSAT